jgi:hypothetical protein
VLPACSPSLITASVNCRRLQVVTTNPFPSMTTPEGRDDPLERAWRSSFVDVSGLRIARFVRAGQRQEAAVQGGYWSKPARETAAADEQR